MPVTFLRCCFWAINAPARQAAKHFKPAGRGREGSSNHKHISRSRCTVVQSYMDYQAGCLRGFDKDIALLPWVIYNLQFDETKLNLCTGVSEDTRLGPLKWSILQQHGLLQWGTGSGAQQQEFVLAPLALLDTSADHLWQGIDVARHGLLGTVLGAGRWCALILNTDAASSNKKVYKHIATSLDVPVIWIRCLQHQTGLIIAMLATFLDIAGSLYCFAKQMMNGEHIETRKELASNPHC